MAQQFNGLINGLTGSFNGSVAGGKGSLKVALVHDWLTGYRGGEKVLEALCELFPDAPLYTLFYIPGSVPKTIESRKIITSFLNSMPFAHTKYRHYLPLFPLAAETLIDDQFDLIVSTSHAVAKSVRPGKSKHWCYIHSPMRYVWDRFDDYFGPDRVGWMASNFFFRPIAWALSQYDARTSHRVGHYVANSHFVATRVERFYHRHAEVIAPPVDVQRFYEVTRKPEDFYLFFSALVPYKKADLAIEACQTLGRKLIVVGNGPELARLKSLANPKWIEFRERVSDQDVFSYYSRARALIFPAIEDFGIVPVEATAAGLPVIGLRAAGLLDSQTDETCVFFDQQNLESLSRAILEFETRATSFSTEKLRATAAKFSKERFKLQVINSIQQFLGN